MADTCPSSELPVEKKQKLVKYDPQDDEDGEFPTTLEGFGLRFIDGKLKDISTGSPFEFEAKKNDHSYNQRRYEAIGEIITDYVYELMVTEGKLRKLQLPVGAKDFEPSTFIFHSKDAFVNEKLIILIHGTGVVRAGQWARKLIINDCLDSGTQLPYIKKAMSLGYGVIVLNTNDNIRDMHGMRRRIRGNESPEKHAKYVWEKIIAKSAAKHIAVVAHSYGGVVTVNLCNIFPTSCRKKIFAIAFTDSVHNLSSQGTASDLIQWFQKVARNWVSSYEPLDTGIPRGIKAEIPCVSAGTPSHEMTSWSSFASVFDFIQEQFTKTVVTATQTSSHSEELR